MKNGVAGDRLKLSPVFPHISGDGSKPIKTDYTGDGTTVPKVLKTPQKEKARRGFALARLFFRGREDSIQDDRSGNTVELAFPYCAGDGCLCRGNRLFFLA